VGQGRWSFDAEPLSSLKLALPINLVSDRHVHPLIVQPLVFFLGYYKQLCEQALRSLESLGCIDGQSAPAGNSTLLRSNKWDQINKRPDSNLRWRKNAWQVRPKKIASVGISTGSFSLPSLLIITWSS
jgi:hypothetical protein